MRPAASGLQRVARGPLASGETGLRSDAASLCITPSPRRIRPQSCRAAVAAKSILYILIASNFFIFIFSICFEIFSFKSSEKS
jgi:hypothetical protein